MARAAGYGLGGPRKRAQPIATYGHQEASLPEEDILSRNRQLTTTDNSELMRHIRFAG
jgi:hypothetical protein